MDEEKVTHAVLLSAIQNVGDRVGKLDDAQKENAKSIQSIQVALADRRWVDRIVLGAVAIGSAVLTGAAVKAGSKLFP